MPFGFPEFLEQLGNWLMSILALDLGQIVS
jgi:hypothetical protein